MIYLDYAADTPTDGEVLDVFLRTEREFFANPNSSHALGRLSAEKLRTETDGIRSFFHGADDYEFIPVATASEANNLAIKGIAESYKEVGRHIISTRLEHPSVGGALTYLQGKGYEVELAEVGRDGRVDVGHLKSLMRKDTILVSVCAVDSELGAIQPTEEIAEIVSNYPLCRFHVDAAQAVGKLIMPNISDKSAEFPFKDVSNEFAEFQIKGVSGDKSAEFPFKDISNKASEFQIKGVFDDKSAEFSLESISNEAAKFSLQGVSCLSFTAHKFYGPKGAAFLVRHKKTVLTPLIHGGSGGSLYRGGTPALALIASANRALNLACADAKTRYKSVLFLNNFLRKELSEIKRIRINSPADASPYILNIGIDGMKGEDVKDALSERGICVSVKSACSVKNMPSKAVYAVTGDKKRALSSFRISLSHLTTTDEIGEFLRALAAICG
jgi:cysteine sulfinate desulfinase/cysteine desulfurase-like protein